MQLLVLGANGPTGRLLVRQAAADGHDVTAVTRHPDTFRLDDADPATEARVRVVQGDVLDAASVDDVVRGQDAVLSTLGVPYGWRRITLYSESIANVLDAMDRHGVGRLVCVSSSATDPATRFHDTGGGFFFERVLKPAITFTMGRQLYADMLRMERLVQASDADWTIVRPSGLFRTDEITEYGTARDEIRGRFTSRRDLADLLLRCATERLWERQAVAVATFDPQPSVLQLMRQEALSGGR